MAKRGEAFHHYRAHASRQLGTYPDGRDTVNLKTYVHASRPALTLRWMQAHPGVVPLMSWDSLLAEVDPPGGLIADLRRLNSPAAEVGEGARRPAVDAFIANAMA